nr:MAG TPA: hypothetical protein [Caudoviricetes sp.]
MARLHCNPKVTLKLAGHKAERGQNWQMAQLKSRWTC